MIRAGKAASRFRKSVCVIKPFKSKVVALHKNFTESAVRVCGGSDGRAAGERLHYAGPYSEPHSEPHSGDCITRFSMLSMQPVQCVPSSSGKRKIGLDRSLAGLLSTLLRFLLAHSVLVFRIHELVCEIERYAQCATSSRGEPKSLHSLVRRALRFKV